MLLLFSQFIITVLEEKIPQGKISAKDSGGIWQQTGSYKATEDHVLGSSSVCPKGRKG